jgi:hypothetical protein
VFALLMSRIYLKGLKQDSSIEEEFQHLLIGNQVKYVMNSHDHVSRGNFTDPVVINYYFL